ncbi:caspase family protein [Streptomyces sp. SP2-10]|uniref:caspase family protein n=1 Tax=Streptomyces sp. SP2-10 TaxID=2873385 RepID=UPI001CA6E544|nr:caspase family protein [Streptomyces sp. SP2-10]MBY8840575.1 caspase family protein [Streptomyces sp. SP2-10]
MTLRAVLIGAQTFGLTGVNTDVDIMHGVLAKHGFTDIRAHVEEEATYGGITRALKQLCRDTRYGDGVVVYFSGHGALHGDLQYLVPVDIEQSTPDDFRGYVAAELTAAVRVLSRITSNVTSVLDSCHSGGAVRDADHEPGRWRLKSTVPPKVTHDDGLARAAALARHNAPLVPNVVRLSACPQHGTAFEAEIRPGAGRQGVFTAALAGALDTPAAHEVPWSSLIARVRDRVKQRQPLQWPDAGGPSGRLPFSLEEHSDPDRLPLVRRDGRFVVPGGALFGLDRGDTLRMVFPRDGLGGDPEFLEATGRETEGGEPGDGTAATVRATVDMMEGGDAVLRTQPETDASTGGSPLSAGLFTAELPPGSYALPLRVHDRRLVCVDGHGPVADALRRQLADCPRLAESREGDAFATVRLRNGTATVVNGDDLPFRKPWEATLSQLPSLTGLLEDLARGDRVRALRDPEGGALLAADVEVRFEIEVPARSGTWRTLPWADERLYDRDRYRVTVTNHSEEPLYFWVLGVGLSGRTTLVTNDQPSGYRIEPHGAPHRSARTTRPVKITWPADVPRLGARPETVHLLVGDRPMDLSVLTSAEARRASEATEPALKPLLQEVWGAFRDQVMEGSEEFHYCVRTVRAVALPHPREAGA